MSINCHVPVVVRVTGQPASLGALHQVLARAVAARLAKANEVLARRHRDQPDATPAPVRERYEPSRKVNDEVALVPSYDNNGQLTGMPVRNAELPLDKRLMIEASRYLGLHGDLDRNALEMLRKVVDAYTCTVSYQAFQDQLRRAGLDAFLRYRLQLARPGRSVAISADTTRMLFGPPPEEPEHWAALSFGERRLPIQISDHTRLVLRDRVVVIPGVGDHADRKEVVPDNYWKMIPRALRAFLTEMAGGPLTPFEENLVANWTSLRPEPLFDGPRIIGYHLVSGGSGDREHRVHDPAGVVVKTWHTEAALINMGLGPIDYLPALRLGGAFLRTGARLATSAVKSELSRDMLLSLRLKAAKPTRAAMEGLDDGLRVPSIGAGGPVPALVVRESSAVAPRTAPAPATAPAPRPVTAPQPGPQVQVRAAAPDRAAAQPTAAPRVRVLSVTAADDVDESWGRTFDQSLSPTTLAPGQGVVTTAPELAAGFTQAQINEFRRILGRSLDHADINILQQLWNRTARSGDAAILTADNSRYLFGLHRNRFWHAVAGDPAASRIFTNAGCAFAGGAPFVVVNGQRIRITIDHIIERQANPRLALTASNLRLAFTRENTVVLRLLNQLGLPWGTP